MSLLSFGDMLLNSSDESLFVDVYPNSQKVTSMTVPSSLAPTIAPKIEQSSKVIHVTGLFGPRTQISTFQTTNPSMGGIQQQSQLYSAPPHRHDHKHKASHIYRTVKYVWLCRLIPELQSFMGTLSL